ncbi:MAG: hypothetical protein OEY80_07820 [Nitrospirota bacterium]|nr:hypothetical protein [Nitrospirota bacterium]
MIRSSVKRLYFACVIFLSALCGCQSSFGPIAIENTHPAYNQAIVTSLNQQMLLNLVRLKYRDTPYFLDVGSVTASLELVGNLGLGAEMNLDSGTNILRPNFGIGYADRPTISYAPLRGEDFLKSVMAPIPLEAILIIIQSGWSIDRVFGLTIERINDLSNAPRASGPTPENEPRYKEFKRLLSLLRILQLDSHLEIGALRDPNSKDLVVLFKEGPQQHNILEELRLLLNIFPDRPINKFIITDNFLDRRDDHWAVRARSIASVLFYLSQNIEIPNDHIVGGLVTLTKNNNGKLFNWNDTPAGNVFKVRSSHQRPDNAFIAIPYRGYWFYIQDNDLESKSTFMLLQALFNLQAGQAKAIAPTLTLPVGR